MKVLFLASALTIGFLMPAFAFSAQAVHPVASPPPEKSVGGALGEIVIHNIAVLVGCMALFFELKNKVSEIKTKIDASNALQSKELELIRSEINSLAKDYKEDIENIKKKAYANERTLWKFIDFINSERASNQKNLFVVSKYDQDE
jgi:hypothetical protein